MSERRPPRVRPVLAAVLAVAAGFTLAACTAGAPTAGPSVTTSPTATEDAPPPNDAAEADEIRATVERVMAEQHLRAVIVEVRRGDEVVLREAWGESMTGVPATTDMHFRSGAVSIPQMSTVLLQLVQEGEVSLDDTLDTWLPGVPHADRVTLGQLAQMTAGYPDYVHDADFANAVLADPFRQWEPEELYGYVVDEPLIYEPGTNWNYSHTDYVLLGLALEQIEGAPLDEILATRVLSPLGLTETADPGTPELQHPALHAYDAERRGYLQIPDGVPFLEDSSYWNPSWTLARGAIQNTDISDMAGVIQAIGRGDLLDDEMHELMVAPTLRGRTTAIEGCDTCFEQHRYYTYGYGIVLSGDWLLQNPLFHGYGGVAGYLPSDDITIAVEVTYGDGAFTADGEPNGNLANPVFTAVADIVAPDADTPGRG